MNNDDLTTMLAVYGSVLATIIFIWEIIKYNRDKPSLKVTTKHLDNLIRFEENEHKIGIKAVNTGTKPVFIKAVGFELKPPLPNGRWADVFDPDLPQEIQAGRDYIIHADPEDIPIERIAYAWVRDGTGKHWKSKKWPLKI